MPPTFAAARNTTCGRLPANQSNTAAWSRRSTWLRAAVCNSMSSRKSRRTSAAPTIPPCPATKTVLPFSSNGVFAIGGLPPGDIEIARHHFLDQLGKRRFRLPAELLARLAGVADQFVNLGGAEIYRIDTNECLAGLAVDAGFLDALAAPLDGAAGFRERDLDEFAHRPGFAGRQHEIVGRVRLQDLVHAFDVIPGVAPIALRLEVSEIKRIVETGLDPGNAARDLACHEGVATDRALMVEQDTVAGIHAVGLAVVHRDPVAVKLGHRIGRARIERRGLLLRNLLNQAVQLRGGRLVEPRLLFHAEDADRLQQPQHADRIGVGGIFRALEADADMALRRQIIDLGRTDLLHQPDQVGGIRHVAIMQQERRVAGVRILIEMIDARGVEGGGPPLDAMDGVAEAEQIFGEIGAVLPGDAGKERDAPFRIRNRHVHSNTTPSRPGTNAQNGLIDRPVRAGNRPSASGRPYHSSRAKSNTKVDWNQGVAGMTRSRMAAHDAGPWRHRTPGSDESLGMASGATLPAAKSLIRRRRPGVRGAKRR